MTSQGARLSTSARMSHLPILPEGLGTNSWKRRQTRSPSTLPQFESSKTSMPIYQTRQKPAIEPNVYKSSGQQYISIPQGANPENKDLTKKVNSWMKDPKRGILPSMNIKNSLSNV